MEKLIGKNYWNLTQGQGKNIKRERGTVLIVKPYKT
jgi:hypothetical protein